MRLNALQARRVGRITVLVGACLATSCALKTEVASNKAAGYTSRPQRLVLIEDIHAGLAPTQVQLFQDSIRKFVGKCEVRLAIVDMPPATIQVSDQDKRREAAFIAGVRPDAILALQTHSVTTGSSAALSYDLALTDMATRKTVWKATVDLRWDPLFPNRTLGLALATAVADRMREDGLLDERCSSV